MTSGKLSKAHSLNFNFQFIVPFFLLACSSITNAQFKPNSGVQIGRTITVDLNGKGDFTKVQDAIDSVPSRNNVWTLIKLKAGVYEGQVAIPQDKPYMILQGEGSGTTVIQVNQAGSSSDSAALILSAENFVASDISFRNTYNLDQSHREPMLWAPAATLWADKASFYRCGFISKQDTLSDLIGRHYFHSCYIEGSVDFIWGNGQSYYELCVLNATGGGFITAQGRKSEDQPTGFVFVKSAIVGVGPTLLGRAYGPYSRVLIKNANITANVKPEGWSAWSFVGHEDKITYAEQGCDGPGSAMSQRVTWMKTLTAGEWDYFTNIHTFLNQDGWIVQPPSLL
ncbi:hypothetical protein K2173_004023 [Erythroxylum novogranatense]|uniref:pectinesterase n=1 Tax=Erythroxylum novogranatense TaxID=1862640 RepID=A0AAV8SJG2_9ROSI|nr:hypothetical protein K2173_004023 [Erythroxylum novogranatense]